MKEAIKLIENAGFDYVIDSTYKDSLAPLLVLKQFPAANERVKVGRTIQLIVNRAVPPSVEMPELLGVRLVSALDYLDRYNLKLADTIMKPDFAKGRILKQLVNGKEIKAGTLIPFGTKVTLVVGSGLGAYIYNYPDVYGMTLSNALKLLDSFGLAPGGIVVDKGTKDSLQALVYKQYPEPIDYFTKKPTVIRQGNTVDLFVGPVLKPREVDTTDLFVDDSTFLRVKEEDIELTEQMKKNGTVDEYGLGDSDDTEATGAGKTKKPKKKKKLPTVKSSGTAAPKPAAPKPSSGNDNDY
jgi:hypothetical protein